MTPCCRTGRGAVLSLTGSRFFFFYWTARSPNLCRRVDHRQVVAVEHGAAERGQERHRQQWPREMLRRGKQRNKSASKRIITLLMKQSKRQIGYNFGKQLVKLRPGEINTSGHPETRQSHETFPDIREAEAAYYVLIKALMSPILHFYPELHEPQAQLTREVEIYRIKMSSDNPAFRWSCEEIGCGAHKHAVTTSESNLVNFMEGVRQSWGVSISLSWLSVRCAHFTCFTKSLGKSTFKNMCFLWILANFLGSCKIKLR